MTDEERRPFARCCRRGDRRAQRGRFAAAREAYLAAWELLPEPREQQEEACAVLGSLGDLAFFEGDHTAALRAFDSALRCPGGNDNPYLHLRRGEILLELGDEANAFVSLTRAYHAGGELIFADEDPRYLNFVHGRPDNSI
jgi:tetratricopeptide (TPR) repeat protein